MALWDKMVLVENKAKEEISWVNRVLPTWAKILIGGIVIGFVLGKLI